MKQRGRPSPDDVTMIVDVSRRQPLSPPPELSDAQAALWRDVVGSHPGNHFTRASIPILVAYCRHTCRDRLLEMQIARFEVEWMDIEGGLERLNLLYAMSERETRAAIACGRSLRLTPSSQMQAKTVGRALANMPSSSKRPWTTEDEDA
jgi:hypothetical protein